MSRLSYGGAPEQAVMRFKRELSAFLQAGPGSVQADVHLNDAIISMFTMALDDLVGECLGDDGKPRAPSFRGLMKARSQLPPAFTRHGFS